MTKHDKKYKSPWPAEAWLLRAGGRYLFGLASVLLGIITLIWHQVTALGGLAHPAWTVYFFGIAEVTGGLALLWKRTIKPGALLLMVVFSVFSLHRIGPILRTPLEFPPYGNFFETFSILLGAVFMLTLTVGDGQKTTATVNKIAYLAFGISVITYALYQLFFLKYTASLVPKWIPPGQMFWAVATTVAFALAAIALLSGRWARPASVWLTVMLVLFGLLVWLPVCATRPQVMGNWTEAADTFAMAATAWIVAGYLAGKHPADRD